MNLFDDLHSDIGSGPDVRDPVSRLTTARRSVKRRRWMMASGLAGLCTAAALPVSALMTPARPTDGAFEPTRTTRASGKIASSPSPTPASKDPSVVVGRDGDPTLDADGVQTLMTVGPLEREGDDPPYASRAFGEEALVAGERSFVLLVRDDGSNWRVERIDSARGETELPDWLRQLGWLPPEGQNP